MDARDFVCDGFEVCFLVVEEKVGFENAEDAGFFDAAHEKSFGCGESPFVQGADAAGVGGSTSGGHDGDAQEGAVGRDELAFFVFKLLEVREFAGEFVEGAGCQGQVRFVFFREVVGV